VRRGGFKFKHPGFGFATAAPAPRTAVALVDRSICAENGVARTIAAGRPAVFLAAREDPLNMAHANEDDCQRSPAFSHEESLSSLKQFFMGCPAVCSPLPKTVSSGMRLSVSKLFVIGLLWLPACATNSSVIREKDAFTGEAIIRTTGNELPQEGHEVKISLDVRYLRTLQGFGRYEFWVHVRYPRDCLKILSGDSLTVFADGKQYDYSSNQGGEPNQSFIKDPGQPVACTEFAVYQAIPQADLLILAQGRSVQIKVTGRNGYVTATLAERNIKPIDSLIRASTAK
jgi:hypothetical protein